jgi:hypothetical protein
MDQHDDDLLLIKKKSRKEPRFIEWWQFAIAVGGAVAYTIIAQYSTFPTKEAVANDINNIKDTMQARGNVRDEQYSRIMGALGKMNDKIDRILEGRK